jgi:hypothetical protein
MVNSAVETDWELVQLEPNSVETLNQSLLFPRLAVVKVVAVTPEAIDVYVPLTVVVDLYTEYEVAWSGETHDIMTVFPLQDPETPLGALTESDFP